MTSSSLFVINDDLVSEVFICRSYHFLLRYDVWPFLLMYCVLVFTSYWSEEYQAFCMIFTPIVLTSHIILFFLVHVFVKVKYYVGYRSVSTIDLADHVLAISSHSNGAGKIISLKRRDPSMIRDLLIAGRKHKYNCEYFEYDKVKYDYDATNTSFIRVQYPVQANVSQILQVVGHRNESDVRFCLSKWGYNFFDIPIPMFLDLYTV